MEELKKEKKKKTVKKKVDKFICYVKEGTKVFLSTTRAIFKYESGKEKEVPIVNKQKYQKFLRERVDIRLKSEVFTNLFNMS